MKCLEKAFVPEEYRFAIKPDTISNSTKMDADI